MPTANWKYLKDVPVEEEYFIAGNSYKLLYDKYLRKICYCDDNSNVVKYNEVDDFTKSICNNVDGYAQLKAGTVIEPLEIITDETGRIWGSYGNCWWVCQNKDGERQAKRV